MSTVKQTLQAARALIEDQARWVKGYAAYSKSSGPVAVRAEIACQWCATGAVAAVTANQTLIGGALSLLRSTLGKSVENFNDNLNTTHAEVLSMYDKAIAAA